MGRNIGGVCGLAVWLCGLAVVMGARGAAGQTRPEAQSGPAASLDEILGRVKSADVRVREKAMEELQDYLSDAKLTMAERLTLIAVAPGLPAKEMKGGSLQVRVMEAVMAKPLAELLGPLEGVFEQLGEKSQAMVIEYHLEVGTLAGVKWFEERFTKDMEKYHWSWGLSDKMLTRLPAEKASALYLQALAHENSTELGVAGLLNGVEQKKFPESLVAENLKVIADASVPWMKKLDVGAAKARAKVPEDYRWEEEYRDALEVAEYFPDLLGHGGKEAEGALRESLKAKAARVSLFAIRSLVKMGLDVPAEDLELVAAVDETRSKLYDYLKKEGQVKLFPEKYRTQEAFARSEMVDWLIYPTELDRAPNDIELMKVVDADTPEGAITVYLFRFRTTGDHWAAKDGWMAGIAGGYRKKDVPTTESTGLTFSSFTKWESKTPEEHVAGIRKLIEEAWKKEGK